MNEGLQYDSIFFDMDGTLWDGVEAYAQGFNDFFQENDIPRRITKNDLNSLMGMEEEIYLAQTLPEFAPNQRSNIYKQVIEFQYRRISQNGGILYSNVKEGLVELSKHYKLFIVSNCPEFTIEYFMKWANIDSYIIDTMSHGKNYKPKHENIRYLIAKHQLKSPIYIGDTDSDRKQCEILNIPFGFVTYGFGNSDISTLRFDTFAQLSDYFLNHKRL